jgi:hypothetical protein
MRIYIVFDFWAESLFATCCFTKTDYHSGCPSEPSFERLSSLRCSHALWQPVPGLNSPYCEWVLPWVSPGILHCQSMSSSCLPCPCTALLVEQSLSVLLCHKFVNQCQVLVCPLGTRMSPVGVLECIVISPTSWSLKICNIFQTLTVIKVDLGS